MCYLQKLNTKKIRNSTELKIFPLYCSKCKKEALINVKEFNVTAINEPNSHRRSGDVYYQVY